jgi:hypothetical protein
MTETASGKTAAITHLKNFGLRLTVVFPASADRGDARFIIRMFGANVASLFFTFGETDRGRP